MASRRQWGTERSPGPAASRRDAAAAAAAGDNCSVHRPPPALRQRARPPAPPRHCGALTAHWPRRPRPPRAPGPGRRSRVGGKAGGRKATRREKGGRTSQSAARRGRRGPSRWHSSAARGAPSRGGSAGRDWPRGRGRWLPIGAHRPSRGLWLRPSWRECGVRGQ